MNEEEQLQALEREMLQSAGQQAAAAIERAERIVRRIERQAARRAEETRTEAERRLTPRREAERLRALSIAELEMNREEATRREEFVERAFDEARRELEGPSGGGDRGDLLARLVKEAVLALPGGRFRVELAPEAAGRWGEDEASRLGREISKEAGREVTLDVMRAEDTFLGGARVTSEDGRARVDQTFEARMERLAGDLRRVVHGELFAEEREKEREKGREKGREK